MRAVVCCIAFAIVFMSGCALSPQEIEVSPRAVVQENNRNYSGSLRVRVVDQRSSQIIGYRGGVYGNTNPIETSRDFALSIQSALELALRQMGFAVTDASDAPDLMLVIEDLQYKVPESSYVTQVELAAAARVEVVKGDQQFSGRYTTTMTEKVIKAPTETQNIGLVNTVLASLLSKTLADEKLQAFLR